ncbi:MAG: DUF1254 domain-containing protein [Hyphomicrobiaceae bacterium]
MLFVTTRAFVLLCCLFVFRAPAEAQVKSGKPDDALAYAAAFAAAVYGLPIEGMVLRMSQEVLDRATRKAGFNSYYHYTSLATPKVSPFRAPNNDTLYSTAWLDLRKEPVILEMPDTGGRYYTAQILDLTTETIANIGQRLNGTEAGAFAIVGPGWTGELPKDIKGTIRSNTVFANVLLRNLVDGPQDVPAVNALQKKFRIRPLSRYRDGSEMPADDTSGLQPFAAGSVPARLELLDRALRMNPVRPGEQGLMSVLAAIGVGPAQVKHPIKPSPAVVARAYGDARTVIERAGLDIGRFVNGWRVAASGMGTYGFDYLQRAAVWAGGPLANVPEESYYPSAATDAAGERLDGARNYVIRFAPGQLPPVNAFWSLTMYRMSDGNLVENEIGRYSIGNRTRGLKTDSDGSLTLFIQAKKPADADRQSNWLPAPKGPFYMVLRLYGPKSDALAGTWLLPRIERQ